MPIMTDLRSTGRLLEVIEKRSESIYGWLVDDESAAGASAEARRDVVEIIAAVVELRRRCDALARPSDRRQMPDAAATAAPANNPMLFAIRLRPS
jgi:hypothetical protein